jgi:hypothetical protein
MKFFFSLRSQKQGGAFDFSGFAKKSKTNSFKYASEASNCVQFQFYDKNLSQYFRGFPFKTLI